ncbi:putative beta-1,4-xylosyltransferase IRX10 [Tetrabaena socialis]|uniref:Putative beta-1,4-xylosyltransferase IRX10 n=1 Tax=Tetrabaena socialis TaxID=47790 RepID=A0A2J8A8D6_9CHLO|nr:putative beta-1,4-xylosyltransferase IRX10 [Tetrabaena socialis]|eukprot:PNH08796.1 putative beta-1,4-xylosyltransferase IRX10 [Tetrabaena socialis]
MLWRVALASELLLVWTLAAAENPRAGVSQQRKVPLTEDAPLSKRCARVRGEWCLPFHTQQPVPWKPAPRGSIDCPTNCNNVGRCNHDTGYCDCPAGWRGPGCKVVQKRPCTGLLRSPDEQLKEPISSIGPDKRDKNWTAPGNAPSRCFGVCDDALALCYCDGPMGRIPAPDDAPPGTPPIRRGRPIMHVHEGPKTGYCNVSKPAWAPICGPEDLTGPLCDQPQEAFCPGACAGHGFCDLGFCRCDEGYYGHDCARRKASLPLLPSSIAQRPWVASQVVEPPAAMEPPPKDTRRRPLIYVYDLEPLYNSKLLQYRIAPAWCTHRYHIKDNMTHWSVWGYAAESSIHEYLLMSEHRTFDPEEADYFYVPHYGACLIYPVMGWADYPWFWTPGGSRVMQVINMMREMVEWLDGTYPFWKRRGGRDHIFLFTHDEGACWAPNVVKDSIWLTHWGRMDLNHTSNTAFTWDNYTADFVNWRQPEGYTKYIAGHPCYDPVKGGAGAGLVAASCRGSLVPGFKGVTHYHRSPLQAAPAKLREIFFYFRGDVGKNRLPHYSRGVRQAIYKMAKEGDWATKHKVLVGDGGDFPGDYSDMLSRSIFCLVAAGDGYSMRMEDAVLHGCIPVIIMDEVHVVFEPILDVDSFSVRLPEAHVPRLLEILQAIPEETIRSKQSCLGKVWHRYRYGNLPGLATELRGQMDFNKQDPLLK